MGIELVAAHLAALCLSVPSELLGLFLLIIKGADPIQVRTTPPVLLTRRFEYDVREALPPSLRSGMRRLGAPVTPSESSFRSAACLSAPATRSETSVVQEAA